MSQMRMQNQIGTTLRPDVAYHMDKHVQNEIKQVGILVITYYTLNNKKCDILF